MRRTLECSKTRRIERRSVRTFAAAEAEVEAKAEAEVEVEVEAGVEAKVDSRSPPRLAKDHEQDQDTDSASAATQGVEGAAQGAATQGAAQGATQGAAQGAALDLETLPTSSDKDVRFAVSLWRGDKGLGLDVDHYRKGATIGYVQPDGVAAKDGRIKMGDMIVAVDGEVCRSYPNPNPDP